MIALRRIDHVCLRVGDLEEAARRWCIEFGFSERRDLRTADRAYLACGYEPYSLELWASRGEPGHDHSAFELREGCSLDDAAAHLGSLGIAHRRDEAGHLQLADPEGYGVELVEFAPRDPYPDVGRTTSTLPGFRPRKLGHVNVLTGQLAAMRDFYRDALGMSITDYLGAEGVWLHVNADHHVMAQVGKTPAHFHHFALDLVDWDVDLSGPGEQIQ
ncbi:MAG: hypothetical protein QOJ07_1124, partial [Thermoleophilaceae bacterium]|nr:hypothetical protein [Thermoleophilaceae bacterium]